MLPYVANLIQQWPLTEYCISGSLKNVRKLPDIAPFVDLFAYLESAEVLFNTDNRYCAMRANNLFYAIAAFAGIMLAGCTKNEPVSGRGSRTFRSLSTGRV